MGWMPLHTAFLLSIGVYPHVVGQWSGWWWVVVSMALRPKPGGYVGQKGLPEFWTIGDGIGCWYGSAGCSQRGGVYDAVTPGFLHAGCGGGGGWTRVEGGVVLTALSFSYVSLMHPSFSWVCSCHLEPAGGAWWFFFINRG